MFLDVRENGMKNQLLKSSSRMPRDKQSLMVFYFVCQIILFKIRLLLKFNNIYEFILFVKESLVKICNEMIIIK